MFQQLLHRTVLRIFCEYQTKQLIISALIALRETCVNKLPWENNKILQIIICSDVFQTHARIDAASDSSHFWRLIGDKLLLKSERGCSHVVFIVAISHYMYAIIQLSIHMEV